MMHYHSLIISRQKVYGFIALTASLSSLFFYILGYPFFKYISILFGFSILVFFVIDKFKGLSSELILSFFCVLFSVLSLRYDTVGGLQVSILLFVSFIASKNVGLRCKISGSSIDSIAYLISLFLYVSFSLYVFLFLYFSGFDKYSANDILAISSRNMVSGMLIVFQGFLSFCSYIKNNKIPIFTPVLTLILTIFLFGRSGIAVSFLILLISILCRFGFIVFWFFVLFSILFFYNFLYEKVLVLMSTTGFAGGLDSPRILMHQEYLQGLNLLSFISGLDYSYSPTITLFDENPHSSILHGHHFMGVAYLMLLFFFILKCLICILFYRESRFSALICGIIVFRGAFDVFVFPGPFDYLLFYIYFRGGVSDAFNKIKESLNKPSKSAIERPSSVV